MVVDGGGGWVTKMFSNFGDTLQTFSTPKVFFFFLGIKRENFLMGLKIDFKFVVSRPYMLP